MLNIALLTLILVIALSLIFDYINGFNDTANAIATCVSTRALSIRSAVIMAAILNFVGAMISTKVATTIGRDIVDANIITQVVILSGVCAAIFWGLTTWYFRIPSSSSHAIIGGIIGAATAHASIHSLHWLGIRKIILSLIISPILGLLVGFVLMIIILWSCKNISFHPLNRGFRRLQIISAAIMAFSHGTADAQKSMGIITMALLSYGYLKTFTVPWPVMAACAIMMSLGTAFGGWRIIKTVGKDFVKLQPVDGFVVQTASSGVILTASAFGLPTSTSHVLTSSILGIGLTKNLSRIDWRIAYQILLAWGLTIPASGIMAYLIYDVLTNFFGK
jgi:inorganic phosphate transporter, PiT family